MHHGSEIPEEIKHLVDQGALVEPVTPSPRGGTDCIGGGDEGEIRYGITCDRNIKKVFLSFGKKILWIGFTPEQAREMAKLLVESAGHAEGSIPVEHACNPSGQSPG